MMSQIPPLYYSNYWIEIREFNIRTFQSSSIQYSDYAYRKYAVSDYYEVVAGSALTISHIDVTKVALF
jgi:hypothetical protein